jgi:hypothetical protein
MAQQLFDIGTEKGVGVPMPQCGYHHLSNFSKSLLLELLRIVLR